MPIVLQIKLFTKVVLLIRIQGYFRTWLAFSISRRMISAF